ncbi:MAG TPA: DUF6314 family protein [Trebonia sp.]|jgi:hypothetical protein|nr:DUF6314 family protein [Trebonia sp.]
MRISDTFGFLLGTWDLSRSYTDHRDGTRSTFQGQAVLAVTQLAGATAGLERARYDETGHLHLGDYRNAASRSLEYRRRADGTVMLYRAGGQPFVELDLTNGAWQASHPCGADHYEISTVVRSRDIVEEHWQVQGPAKDYTAVATLHRILR